ncbi:MAG: ribonuclease HII, partial [Lachnospiraceae bacterium]|nr:ribonuclease HII [Lachnospiraceae bacterium]
MKISEIKEILNKAEDNALPELIEEFSEDERDGVRKLVASAVKRLEKLEAERKRIYELSAYERQFAELGLVCG